MALRKIKELIREMVFENQTDEHEYAAVMANLVLDVEKWQIYENALEKTAKTAKDYDARIQKINAAIDKKKQKIEETKSQKQVLSAEVFKNAMAKLNQQQGILKKLQTQTIREKLDAGFPSLDEHIKKYACLKYLADICLKQSDFKTVVGKDGFIYADEAEFKGSEIASDFREISDYVDYIFGNRASKIVNEQSIVDIIKADAKSVNLDLKDLTAVNIKNVYQELQNKIAKENNKKISEQKNIIDSHIGLREIRDFGNGLKMYRLMPDTEYYEKNGEHRNLVYESNQMGICIGQKGQAYSQKILELDKNQYYTLRSEEANGQLVPHCTIEVNGDVINQVKGKSNGPVNLNYIKQVREFLRKDLDASFPGDYEQHKRSLHDFINIGFVNDINDITVDIFNLEPNTEFESLSWEILDAIKKDANKIKKIGRVSIDLRRDLEDGTTKRKQFSDDNKKTITAANVEELTIEYGTIKCKDLDFGDGLKKLILHKCDLSEFDKLKVNKNTLLDLSFSINSYKSSDKNLDFSEINKLSIIDWNFYGYKSVKFNPNAEELNLSGTGNIPFGEKFDFSHVKKLFLMYTDWLSGDLDFSGIEELNLMGADLSKVTSIKFNPNAKVINLGTTRNLSGDLDFRDVEELNLTGADLSKVTSIKFNPNTKRIDLHEAILPNIKSFKGKVVDLSNVYSLSGDLDFSEIEELDLRHTDLSKVTSIKFNPNARKVVLAYTKGLNGELDLSGIEELNLNTTDLSKVTSIKFNPNAKEVYLSDADLSNIKSFKGKVVKFFGAKNLSGDLDFSEIEELDLRYTDLSKVTSIKFNPNVKTIDLHGAILPNIKSFRAKVVNWEETQNLSGDLDFSGVEHLNLRYADLSKVTSIKFNPNAKTIDLRGVKNLPKNIKFPAAEVLDLVETDLSNVKIVAKKVFLERCNLTGVIDVSEASVVKMAHAKINDAHIKLNPNANESDSLYHAGMDNFENVYNFYAAEIKNTKITAQNFYVDMRMRLSGIVDFSDVEELVLDDCNMSELQRIKFNPNAKTIRIYTDVVDYRHKFSAKEFENLNVEKLYLSGLSLDDNLDFRKAKKVFLVDVNLNGTRSIKAHALEIAGNTTINNNMDLSEIKHLSVESKIPSYVTMLNLPGDTRGISKKDIIKYKMNYATHNIGNKMADGIAKLVKKVKQPFAKKERDD